LRSRSCIIDGEAVACDDNGVASFDLIRHHRHNDRAFLYAFDLIELNGDEMRRDPLEMRKAMLRSMPKLALACASTSTWKATGLAIFVHACKMGLEGILSKRLGARLAEVQEPGGAGGEARVSGPSIHPWHIGPSP